MSAPSDIFRKEAWEAYRSSEEEEAPPLKLPAARLRSGAPLLALGVLVALVALGRYKVPRYRSAAASVVSVDGSRHTATLRLTAAPLPALQPGQPIRLSALGTRERVRATVEVPPGTGSRELRIHLEDPCTEGSVVMLEVQDGALSLASLLIGRG